MFRELNRKAIIETLAQQIRKKEHHDFVFDSMSQGGDGCSLGASVNYHITAIGICRRGKSWIWYVEGGGPHGYWITESDSEETDCPQQAFSDPEKALASLSTYLRKRAERESAPEWGTVRAPF
ncbi:MAG TPA: hypothetical protein GX404_03900 [Syntrophomonadaceae bacterium]|nr:hypothetical protein [Syntrophomonadaceae bacterium]